MHSANLFFRNYLKTMHKQTSDTKVVNRQTGSAPDNSRLSFRNAPSIPRHFDNQASVPVYHPSPCRMPFLPLRIEFLFTDAANMTDISVLAHRFFPRRIIVGFIQTQVLRFTLRWLGAPGHDGLNGLVQELCAPAHWPGRPSTASLAAPSIGPCAPFGARSWPDQLGSDRVGRRPLVPFP